MKKIQKITEIFLICIFVLTLSSTVCFAESDSVSDLIGQDAQNEIYSLIPSETQQMLEEIGIESIDFDSIFSASPQKALSLFKKLITGGIESPAHSMIRLLAIIIMIAVCECFIPENDRIRLTVEMAGVVLCVLSVAEPLTTAISSAVSSVAVSEKLMLALIPVLAAVVSLAGNPLLATSFQSIAFFMAQAISAVSQNYIVPVVGAVLVIDIAGSLVPDFKLDGITSVIKKVITVVLSFVSTLFVSFLGLKGALANSADTVAGRGIKMIISSAVPVIGGALSEAYSGIAGTLVLARSAIGIFGIAVIALVNLPSCMQLLFWIFCLRICSAVGGMFNQTSVASLLKNIASAITLLNVVLLFNAVLFIISTALILLIKAG